MNGFSSRITQQISEQRVDFGRRTLVVRRSWGSLRIDLRSIVVCLALAVAVIVLALLAMVSGS